MTDNEREKKSPDLYGQLSAYGASDFYPFHMPGHKRNFHLLGDPYAIDITEIDGFDNLHHAGSVLLDAQRRAAQLYGAEETFYLVNGSTCGILSAVSACTKRGETILMARGCHKAAYHALLLNDLHAKYLYPPADMTRGILGAIQPEQVRSALDAHPEIHTVLLTSPTYDGVVSDIKSIAEIVHEKGAALIVDEAHGAHFGMHPYFPERALVCGADLVINSVHKTLPSLTQTALLHVQGPRIGRERLRQYLGIYQSSSPSYVFMAGIDRCIGLLERQGKELFETFVRRLERLRASLSDMKKLHLVDGNEDGLLAFDYDRSKIVISTENSQITGAQLSELLRTRYHLETEMDAPQYVTAITTIGDTQEGLERLGRALSEIDAGLIKESGNHMMNQHLEDERSHENKKKPGDYETIRWGSTEEKTLRKKRNTGESIEDKKQLQKPDGSMSDSKIQEKKESPDLSVLMADAGEEVLGIAQANEAGKREVRLEESGGLISGEFVYLYPPGIPFLAPGERIPERLPEQLERCRKLGLQLQGMADYTGEKIRVIEERNSQNGKNILHHGEERDRKGHDLRGTS